VSGRSAGQESNKQRNYGANHSGDPGGEQCLPSFKPAWFGLTLSLTLFFLNPRPHGYSLPFSGIQGQIYGTPVLRKKRVDETGTD